jgi:hypothetical protein
LSGGWQAQDEKHSYTESDSEDGGSDERPAHRGEQQLSKVAFYNDREFALAAVNPVFRTAIAE